MAIRLDAFGHPVYVTGSTRSVVQPNKYFYRINFTLIDRTNDIQYKINSNINGIRISNDYQSLVFPILRVSLTASVELYKIIRDNEVEVRMDIYKLVLHDDSSIENVQGAETEVYFTNELFTIIDKNSIIFNDDDLNEEIPSLDLIYTLFAKKHLAINKQNFNGNYLNCRLVDMLAMSVSKIYDDVLIERPTNMTEYKQILIPPLNACRLPRYLQEIYSMYEDGILIHYGLTETIICNSELSENTPLAKNDYLHVILDLEQYNNVTGMPNECSYNTTDGRFYYIKTLETNIKISDKSLTNQEIFGSRNIVFGKKSNLSTEKNYIDEKEEDTVVEKRQVYYDKYDDMYLNETDAIQEPISAIMKFSNLDIASFKPNKLFFCRLNGKEYQLKPIHTEMLFRKDSNTDLFTLTGTCNFIAN